MITTRFLGQLGNQMFQYVMGHILAARTGIRYWPPANWLDKRGQPLEVQPPFRLKMAAYNVGPAPQQIIRTGHWLDLDSIHGPVRLEFGYFQRYELLQPWKRNIKWDWLHINAQLPETDPDAVYVHVRRKDYVANDPGCPEIDSNVQCVATTLEEFDKCLRAFHNFSRLVILTDDKTDPFIQKFHEITDRPVTISYGSYVDDFLTMASARQLLISQSTFSWWAGFLGRAERIVCPMFPGSHWQKGMHLFGPPKPGGFDYPNLVVYDEPHRWVWMEE